MKLTAEDKKLLKKWGHKTSDYPQIEKAMNKGITIYELDLNDGYVSRDEAIVLLGREVYLSGVARSAFHWSAARETKDKRTIYFDSSRLFN
ncbi:MAG: hypothetical protein RSF40_01485 [Oscillospiraceae bacterium]